MDPIVSLETIGRQASAAARQHLATGRDAKNPYCPHLQPDHHAEFARRFYCALQRLGVTEEAEGSA